MTHEEWNQIVEDKIRPLWPRSSLPHSALNLHFERRLGRHPAAIVEGAVVQFALDSPDSTRGLLQHIDRYCRERTHRDGDGLVNNWFTGAERRNIVRAVRGRDVERFDGWSDEDLWQEWLRQEGYGE